MTTAQKIAEQFGNDGQQWTDAEGRRFEDVCAEQSDRVLHHQRGIAGAPVRYEFSDGSALVVAGDGWDLGFPGEDLECYCWPEANGGRHTEECGEAS